MCGEEIARVINSKGVERQLMCFIDLPFLFLAYINSYVRDAGHLKKRRKVLWKKRG